MDASENGARPIQEWMLWAWPAGALALAICGATVSEYVRSFLVLATSVAIGGLGASLLFFFAGRPARSTRRMQAHEAAGIGRLLPRRLAPSILFSVAATSGAWLLAPVLLGAASETRGLDALWLALAFSTWGGFMGCVAARWGAPRARQLGVSVAVVLPLSVALVRNVQTAAVVDAICPLSLILNGRLVTEATSSTMLFACALWGTAAVAFLAGMFRAARLPAAGTRRG
jgi:hypothetical protein